MSQIRILVIYVGGGVEDFFAEAGEKAQKHELPPPPTEAPDIAQLLATAEKHGLRMKPPEGAPA